jgi:hypothetical protein
VDRGVGLFMASPMSSMMLMVCMFGWSVANGDVGVTGSCLVALLQLRPMTVPWLSEWMHLLCFMMSRSCIYAGISIVVWQGIMVLFGGRNNRFLVHVCMCMLHSSLTSSTYCLYVYIASAEDSTWYLLLGVPYFWRRLSSWIARGMVVGMLQRIRSSAQMLSLLCLSEVLVSVRMPITTSCNISLSIRCTSIFFVRRKFCMSWSLLLIVQKEVSDESSMVVLSTMSASFPLL